VTTVDERLGKAVEHFWRTRTGQDQRQGVATGQRDHGSRAAVTGGKQLDGFAILIYELLIESGLPGGNVFTRKRDVVLPGYFRPSKEWDLIVIYDNQLIASVEFKSQVGSFANNFNNRVEEALGNATDLHTAYREGAFAPAPQPWMGYLMLMQQAPESTRPARLNERHFPARDEWKNTSYAKRYEMFCQKIVRERLYDAACFLLSDEVGFRNFAASLVGHVSGVVRMK
jgi:hypothetical protein